MWLLTCTLPRHSTKHGIHIVQTSASALPSTPLYAHVAWGYQPSRPSHHAGIVWPLLVLVLLVLVLVLVLLLLLLLLPLLLLVVVVLMLLQPI